MKKKIRKKRGKNRKSEEIPLMQKSSKSKSVPKSVARPRPRPTIRLTSIITSVLTLLGIFALVVICKRLDEKIKHVKVESSLEGIQRELIDTDQLLHKPLVNPYHHDRKNKHEYRPRPATELPKKFNDEHIFEPLRSTESKSSLSDMTKFSTKKMLQQNSEKVKPVKNNQKRQERLKNKYFINFSSVQKWKKSRVR